MMMPRWITVLCLSASTAFGGSLVEDFLASYDAVESMSCEIRRDTPLSTGGSVRMLSRVYFERPDKLHVENFSPICRRILSDGKMFRSKAERMKQGFARPVTELSDEMLRNLRMVPGSAANMLEILVGAEEVPLDANGDCARRAGYRNEHSFAVLCVDEKGRLLRFSLFASDKMKELLTHTEFSHHKEVIPGAWISHLQKSTVYIEGLEREETVRIDNVEVNGDIPPGLFNPDAFFKDVTFVDSFDDIELE